MSGLKSKSDQIGFDLLNKLGFNVIKLNESHKQEADFEINYNGVNAIVEMKLKNDNEEDITSKQEQLKNNGCSWIGTQEGYKNNASKIIRKADQQIVSTSNDRKNDFAIALFVSDGINAKTKANIFQDTLYGRISIIIGQCEKKCYFYSYSEFLRGSLDAAIISYIDNDKSIKTIFCINPYSQNYNELRVSKILEPFKNAIIDPFELEKEGSAFIVDKHVDRKLTGLDKLVPMNNPILKHIKDKYKIDGYIINGDFKVAELTSII